MLIQSSTQPVSANTQPQQVQTQAQNQQHELDPSDPIWRHVKSDWDRQFVRRANFIPWLRAQLSIDPLDESSPNPEPLVNYIKRRLTLVQKQQKQQTTTASHAVSNAELTASSKVPVANVVAPQAATSVITTPAGTNWHTSPNEARLPSGTLHAPPDHPTTANSTAGAVAAGVTPLPTQAPGTLYGANQPNNLQIKEHTSPGPYHQHNSPTLSHPFNNGLNSPAGNNVSFSSQLGAIADAHMGNSNEISTPFQSQKQLAPLSQHLPFAQDSTSQLATPSSRAQPFTYSSYEQPQSEGLNVDRVRQPQMLTAQHVQHPQSFQFLPNTQDQPTFQLNFIQTSPLHAPLSCPPSASLSSSTATPEPHPLEPQNVNRYLPLSQPAEHQEFIEPRQKLWSHPGHSSLANNKDHGYSVATSIVEDSLCPTPRPLATIDPTLMIGHELLHINSPRNDSPVPPKLPAISPAVDATVFRSSPTLAPASTVDNTRRTRSSAASKKVSTPVSALDVPSAPKPAAVAVTVGPAAPKVLIPKEPQNKPVDAYDRKAWKSRLSIIRSELDHMTKAPHRAATKLVKILSMYSAPTTPTSGDWSTVPPDGRLEVLSAIRASASKDFYNIWTQEPKGLAILEAWLKGAVIASEKVKHKDAVDDDASERENTLMLLLQMLEKLPITIENLKHYTFAKQVLKINKEANAPKFPDKTKQLSSTLEQIWRGIARGASSSAAKTPSTASSNLQSSSIGESKKRSEPSTDSTLPKKRKIEAPAKANTALSAPENKNSSTLFGKSDKPKLPPFTKKAPEPSSAALTVLDPFAEAMAALKGRNAGSHSAELMMPSTTATQRPNGRPSKRVTFAPDGELCQIKIVERLVYEGEECEIHPSGDARKLDAIEGRYLHHVDSFLEEEMEWETPLEVVLTSETLSNLETSPLVSLEAQVQTEREKAITEVTYHDESQVPDTPVEPVNIQESDTPKYDICVPPKLMKLGGDLLLDTEIARMIARAQADTSAHAPVAADDAVSDLLARLGGPGSQSSSQLSAASTHVGFDMSLLNSISQSGSFQALFPASGSAPSAVQPVSASHLNEPNVTTKRDNGWGAAAGSARSTRGSNALPPFIPSGPSAGVARHKRRKKGKDGGEPRLSAYDSQGRHIKCKYWPHCPHGNKCFYKHA